MRNMRGMALRVRLEGLGIDSCISIDCVEVSRPPTKCLLGYLVLRSSGERPVSDGGDD